MCVTVAVCMFIVLVRVTVLVVIVLLMVATSIVPMMLVRVLATIFAVLGPELLERNVFDPA
jgi:Mg/Co/Ni transporter MgtE